MDDLPFLEPVQKLTGIEKMVGVFRSSEPGLFSGKCLVEKHASWNQRFLDAGHERPVQVSKDQDDAVSL